MDVPIFIRLNFEHVKEKGVCGKDLVINLTNGSHAPDVRRKERGAERGAPGTGLIVQAHGAMPSYHFSFRA